VFLRLHRKLRYCAFKNSLLVSSRNFRENLDPKENIMSKLIFNGALHQISLIDSNGQIVGTWAAYNNIDSHATLTHLQNRAYTVQDQTVPHQHMASANGPYGLYGIVRFNVSQHPGIGVHSGRANARHLPGPQHPTMGCIRTTDEAMLVITRFMRTSPLTTVEVINNNMVSACTATHRNQYRHLDRPTHA
jgi:hypothetical protein